MVLTNLLDIGSSDRHEEHSGVLHHTLNIRRWIVPAYESRIEIAPAESFGDCGFWHRSFSYGNAHAIQDHSRCEFSRVSVGSDKDSFAAEIAEILDTRALPRNQMHWTPVEQGYSSKPFLRLRLIGESLRVCRVRNVRLNDCQLGASTDQHVNIVFRRRRLLNFDSCREMVRQHLRQSVSQRSCQPAKHGNDSD